MADQTPKTGEIVDDGSIERREAIDARLAELWWTFLIRGLLAAAVGIAALFWPTGSISLLMRLVGVLLILDGGVTLLGFGRRGIVGGFGLGAIIIGFVLLVWPEGFARLTFFLLGAWALIVGVGSLATWRQVDDRSPEKNTLRNSGFAALAIGLILIFWPGTGLVALGWAVAFSALAFAVVMFWLAKRFKAASAKLAMRTINQ